MIKYSRHLTCQSNSFEGAAIDHFQSQIRKMAITAERSGGQTGEWALVQEEQMGPLLTPGKISLNR